MPPAAALSFEEPTIVAILIYSSFLLLNNIVNYALDRVLYCGLLGQVFIGVAFGTPGGKWLADEAETVVMQLGYLGLILLVYEGGLSTSFASLKANLALSIAVALTGISLPIALSFILRSLSSATPLQAFAAGAALCSTSLGTTFTVLQSSQLTTTRLGTVLSSAAMMDDVVGLIMVQVISNLGPSNSASSGFDPVTVIRPVFVSLGFALGLPLICWLVVRPLANSLNAPRQRARTGFLNKLLGRDESQFVLHTALLLGLVVAASYAGTSNLFASYLAGATVSWWDSEIAYQAESSAELQERTPSSARPPMPNGSTTSSSEPQKTGSMIYEKYYHASVVRILKPFFFASIGFSIPITKLFSANIVWRGIIYTLLMAAGKLACGIWLLRFPNVRLNITSRIDQFLKLFQHISSTINIRKKPARKSPDKPGDIHIKMSVVKKRHNEDESGQTQSSDQVEVRGPEQTLSAPSLCSPDGAPSGLARPESSITPAAAHSPSQRNPHSPYPALILGGAMTARGEIGFLISALAQSRGIYSDEIFYVVTWAIVLCTMVGPIMVGLLVRRVRALESKNGGSRGEVMGIWGV